MSNLEKTVQEKREKVVRDLQWAVTESDVFDALYADDLEGVIDTMKGALELLTARLMTVQEILEAEVVYLQDVNKPDVIPGLVCGQFVDRIGFAGAHVDVGAACKFYPLISEYMKRWCAWTARPTEEQQKSVKWNNETTDAKMEGMK